MFSVTSKHKKEAEKIVNTENQVQKNIGWCIVTCVAKKKVLVELGTQGEGVILLYPTVTSIKQRESEPGNRGWSQGLPAD